MTSVSDPSAGLSPIPAGRYRLDPAQCAVRADVKAMFGLLTVHGSFRVRSGEVVIADNPADSSVTVVLDAGSFASGNTKRDRDVTSAALLDAATYPEIAFVSDSVRSDGAGWVITGQVSAHGTTVATEVRVDRTTLQGGVAAFHGSASLQRADFGITNKKGMVGHTAAISIDAIAVPA